jgi:hypothetical protein
MTTRTLPKLIALILAFAVSAAWLSTVVNSMHSKPVPMLSSVELPRVVVVARKASASDATAQVQPVPGNNG